MLKKNKTIITSENETFLVRTLEKKINDADVNCEFVHWKVNDLNAHLDDVELVIVYMEDGERPTDSVTHFMSDRLMDEGKQVILIGEKNDLQLLEGKLPKDLIFKSFERPVDHAAFIDSVNDFFQKVEDGDFKKSILVVDDDPNFLNLIREWLTGTYKVTLVNSGLQAIKYLGKNKVDLILLDHEMPVTSGPQVLEMLRSDDETKGIPVMFLTGKSDKESVMAVVALKPEGYFLKTIEREELLKNLAKFFTLNKQ